MTDYNLLALRFAVRHERMVSFRYAKGAKQAVIERRRLRPKELQKHPVFGYTVIGLDPDREDYRTFRLDRMLGDVTITSD